MKIGHNNIALEDTLLYEEETKLLASATTGRKNLSDIADENEWRGAVSHLEALAEMMIGGNQLDSGKGFKAVRSLLFKLHGYNPRNWKSYISSHTHPPTGRLLALWLLPPSHLRRGLKDLASC